MCCYRIPKTSFAYRRCHETSHSFATLFSEFDVILPHPFSIAITTFQLFSDHLSSSQFLQLFSTALKVVPSLLLLSSTLFTSSLLFSTLPNDFRLHSSQLAPTLFTSCHVLNSSHLFSALINCSHLFLSSCLKASHLLNCGRLFSTLVTSCHSVNEMLTEVN